MDVIDTARYFGALILVLALIGLAWVAARKFGLPGIVSAGGARRIGVAESLMLDGRHKLYLIRRDAVEHLLVIGPQGATVVESGVHGGDPVPDKSDIVQVHS